MGDKTRTHHIRANFLIGKKLCRENRYRDSSGNNAINLSK